jgi:hypothetical protein
MTRQHASGYQPPEDPYAHARCECGHFVNAGQEPGGKCQYSAEGCSCTDHRLPSPAPDSGDAA